MPTGLYDDIVSEPKSTGLFDDLIPSDNPEPTETEKADASLADTRKLIRETRLAQRDALERHPGLFALEQGFTEARQEPVVSPETMTKGVAAISRNLPSGFGPTLGPSAPGSARRGAEELAGETLSSLTVPTTAAGLVLAPVAPEVMLPLFGYQGYKDIPEAIAQGVTGETPAEKVKGFGRAALDAGMVLPGLKAAGVPIPPLRDLIPRRAPEMGRVIPMPAEATAQSIAEAKRRADYIAEQKAALEPPTAEVPPPVTESTLDRLAAEAKAPEQVTPAVKAEAAKPVTLWSSAEPREGAMFLSDRQEDATAYAQGRAVKQYEVTPQKTFDPDTSIDKALVALFDKHGGIQEAPQNPEFIKALTDAGYDSVKGGEVGHGGESNWVIVFDKRRVKEVTPKATEVTPSTETPATQVGPVKPEPITITKNKVGKAFNSLVEKMGRDEVQSLLGDWNESELSEDGTKIKFTDTRGGGGKWSETKSGFFQWLFSDEPKDPKQYDQSQEWVARIDNARKIASEHATKPTAEPPAETLPGETKGEAATYYRAGQTKDRGGVQYVAESPELAAQYAEGGTFGRPGAKVEKLTAKLKVFDGSKASPAEQESIIGKIGMRYREPDGNINFHAFEGDTEIAKRLKDAGYDAIRISEGENGTSIAVLEHAKEKLKSAEVPPQAPVAKAQAEVNPRDAAKRIEQVIGKGASDALTEAKAAWAIEKDYGYRGLERLKQSIVIGIESAFGTSRPMAEKIASDLIEGRKTILDKLTNLEPIRESELKNIGSYPSAITKFGYERGERGKYTYEGKHKPKEPPTPPAAEGAEGKGSQALGIVPPGTTAIQTAIDWFRDAPRKARVMLAQLAGKSAPHTSTESVESGNSLVHYASAKIAAPTVAKSMATDVLGEHHTDPVFGNRLGAVLVEDRLRAIRKALQDAGDPDAANVETVIGKDWSPLKTEADFTDALNDPEIKAAIERHKSTVQETAEAAHEEAGGELAGPGLNTGAFVNLKALLPEETAPAESFATGGRGNLENPLRKVSRFFKQAKGTGKKYVVDYRTLAERMIEGNFEEAAKRNMYNQLVKDGLAVLTDPGDPRPTIGGKPAVMFTIERRGTPMGEGRARTFIKRLWVRSDVAGEVRQALDTDGAVGRSGFAAAANLINRIQLAGPTDAVWHTANMLGSIAGSQGGKTLLTDLARKLPGVNIADALGRTVASGIRVLHDSPDVQRQLAQIAEIGALRGQHPAGPIGRTIQFIDKAGRLVRDDMYKNLVDRGLVENSEAARREWVNQMGQYNGRLMGQFQRFFKEAGFSPFIVAGRNFNRMAMRRMTLDPGIKASSAATAAEMRAIEAFGTIATLIAIPAFVNQIMVGSPSGRPGVKMGQIDTGKTDKEGKAIVIDPAQWTGLRRGLRISGAQAVIEGVRHQKGAKEIARQAKNDILGGILHPWTGPAPTAAAIAATGYDPRFYKESVDTKDVGGNVKAALKNLNPIAEAILTSREKETSTLGELGLSLGGAAGIKSVRVQDAKSQLADLHSAWMRNNKDPKVAADYERNSAAEYPKSKYKELDDAIRTQSEKKALESIEELRKTEKDAQIFQRFVKQRNGPLFQESMRLENQFRNSLTPEQKALYEQAKKDRQDRFKKFTLLWARRSKR